MERAPRLSIGWDGTAKRMSEWGLSRVRAFRARPANKIFGPTYGSNPGADRKGNGRRGVARFAPDSRLERKGRIRNAGPP